MEKSYKINVNQQKIVKLYKLVIFNWELPRPSRSNYENADFVKMNKLS